MEKRQMHSVSRGSVCRVGAALALSAAWCVGAIAQGTPAQTSQAPADPAPAAAQGSPQVAPPTFNVTSNLVLVPTLVEGDKGKVVFGLGPEAFHLLDNGVPQKVHVDEEMDTTPVSLVVAVEKGRSADLQFATFDRLAPLLSQFLGNGTGRVKLMEFDSTVEFEDDWTRNTDQVQQDFDQIRPGDGGAAILDAAGYAVQTLEQQPGNRRRILLLISESRDHGSKHVTAKQLAEQIGASNVLVLNLTWSPVKSIFVSELTNPGPGGILYMIALAINAMKANAAKSLAVMSGGESMSFGSEHSFEDRVAEMASHAENRYLLTFQPTELTPGLHRIQVQLDSSIAGQVVARKNYWAGSLDPDDNEPAEDGVKK